MKLPIEFIHKYQQLLGDEAKEFLASFQEKSYSGYRINPLKPDFVIDQNYLTNEKIEYCDTGFFGSVNGKSIDHTVGYLYSQEPSAMYVGEVADPKPNERVLDLCAAPGGKSTHLVSKMNNEGLLVSNEIFKKRATILAENLERWGAKNTIITNESPEKLAPRFLNFFDRILVDAPCSGEGMFRKDPEAVSYWNIDYPLECANRQRKILASAMEMLKPGGTLIYSTCTFAPEEDEQIIAWLLTNYPTLSVEPIKKYTNMDSGRPEWADNNSELAKTVRLFPHHIKGEGHFIAKLKLAGNDISNKNQFQQTSKLTKEQVTLFNDFTQTVLNQINFNSLITFGDQLYSIPDGVPSLDHLSVIRPGLHLGTFKKKRFEPSFALALALDSSSVKNKIKITEEQWREYVHGDTIKLDHDLEKGWYLLTCQGHSVCFGKAVNRTVKNFYPKGLRF
ncbi:23S rRNA methyltransferase [Paucilactobacillus hokkaidonensis JCM 18461]|uniref:23S rRNA methyltransferase n=2 Tax=Paucilactobacillus hokkaidonensis TaxID=1193095 RepID=A0A0A1GXE2_9LACO|nr:RsmB/NOP family class I SAM-dependent RNA methyltransferase [Paucilactobacillus hokkaidonensis]KRO10612.1 tRNA rRNA methyltransferase [Paucilactobacillus hokkaidonensis]BAP85603.1 23S rRNA methyltransferase [Paucilactobacillus hokkaidonensis JCM 18461]